MNIDFNTPEFPERYTTIRDFTVALRLLGCLNPDVSADADLRSITLIVPDDLIQIVVQYFEPHVDAFPIGWCVRICALESGATRILNY